MELAKDHIDVGLFTNNLEPMLAFWQQDVGLAFEELLPTGGGNRQHRHAMNGSVLKLNHARDPLPEAPPSGYRELLIARAGLAAPRELRDPDGNRVTLVPLGHRGIVAIGVRFGVCDLEAFRRFFGHTLQLPEVSPGVFEWGDTLFFLEQDPAALRTEEMRAPGFRYITVQVRDVEKEHAAFLQRGAEEGRAPVTLGATARISFIRDPDGNWIEVSQRASLTGTLEPDPAR
ncbi:MAG: VOC family protein [Anaerolinea sp.]|nr:VOC family protein [Anaerolinea sp.]